MTKQEFLAMSLPYMVKCQTKNEFIYQLVQIDTSENLFFGQSEIKMDDGYYPYIMANCNPILHPLSDLTKEIEHKGEKFVPIYKIFNPPVPIDQTQIANEVKSYNLYAVIKKNDVVVYKIKKDYTVIPFWIVQKLIEWHFDIAGLIEKGEAIDVNTLPENPYK